MDGIGIRQEFGGRRWMSDEKGWHHDEEKHNGNGQDREEVRVEANEGVDGQEREGVGGSSPREETDQAILEDEDDSNPIRQCVSPVAH